MTKEEINKYIHVEIMGLLAPCKDCGHIRPVTSEICHNPCRNLMIRYTMPDYCSDSSPRSLLNEVVVKVTARVGDLYFRMLEIELYRTWRDRGRPKTKLDHLSDVVAANAEQIARATVAAHQEAKQ